jgi:hypothetical protein
MIGALAAGGLAASSAVVMHSRDPDHALRGRVLSLGGLGVALTGVGMIAGSSTTRAAAAGISHLSHTAGIATAVLGALIASAGIVAADAQLSDKY